MLLLELLENSKRTNSKLVFVLIDPDKFSEENIDSLIFQNKKRSKK